MAKSKFTKDGDSYTYRSLNVHALVTKRWDRSYSRDRETGRKVQFWQMVAYKDGHEVRRRFKKLSEAETWLNAFTIGDERTADKTHWNAE